MTLAGTRPPTVDEWKQYEPYHRGRLAVLKTIKQRSFSFNVERNINYWKYALQISVPLIFHVVSISILTQSDRVIIASLRGNAEAGIYGLSYQYGILISVITNAICEAYLNITSFLKIELSLSPSLSLFFMTL